MRNTQFLSPSPHTSLTGICRWLCVGLVVSGVSSCAFAQLAVGYEAPITTGGPGAVVGDVGATVGLPIGPRAGVLLRGRLGRMFELGAGPELCVGGPLWPLWLRADLCGGMPMVIGTYQERLSFGVDPHLRAEAMMLVKSTSQGSFYVGPSAIWGKRVRWTNQPTDEYLGLQIQLTVIMEALN